MRDLVDKLVHKVCEATVRRLQPIILVVVTVIISTAATSGLADAPQPLGGTTLTLTVWVDRQMTLNHVELRLHLVEGAIPDGEHFLFIPLPIGLLDSAAELAINHGSVLLAGNSYGGTEDYLIIPPDMHRKLYEANVTIERSLLATTIEGIDIATPRGAPPSLEIRWPLLDGIPSHFQGHLRVINVFQTVIIKIEGAEFLPQNSEAKIITGDREATFQSDTLLANGQLNTVKLSLGVEALNLKVLYLLVIVAIAFCALFMPKWADRRIKEAPWIVLGISLLPVLLAFWLLLSQTTQDYVSSRWQAVIDPLAVTVLAAVGSIAVRAISVILRSSKAKK